MSDELEEAAERHVREQLELAREAYRQHPPGPGDSTLEEYERSLRAMVASHGRPTAPYVGLTLAEAEALAAQEGRRIRNRTGGGGRANWVSNRVNVVLGEDGRVVTAEPDRAYWLEP